MFKRATIILIVLLWAGVAFADHPLITDEAGVPHPGTFKLELNGDFSHRKAGEIITDKTEIGALLCYGMNEHMELIIGLPYRHLKVKEGENTITQDGISDTAVEVKWRFLEQEGLSLALKPGIVFPTGDYKKELGTGKVRYGLAFIATKELHEAELHFNLGYERNENKLAERTDIWRVSLAAVKEAAEHLKLVANIGIEKNPARNSNTDPAYILAGLMYSATKDLNLNLGFKVGLNNAAPDYSILPGIVWKF